MFHVRRLKVGRKPCFMHFSERRAGCLRRIGALCGICICIIQLHSLRCYNWLFGLRLIFNDTEILTIDWSLSDHQCPADYLQPFGIFTEYKICWFTYTSCDIASPSTGYQLTNMVFITIQRPINYRTWFSWCVQIMKLEFIGLSFRFWEILLW